MVFKEEKEEEQCQKESAEGKPERAAREERDAKQIEEENRLNIYFNNLKNNILLLKYVRKKIISTSLF